MQEYDLELEDYDLSESQDSDGDETSTMMFTGRTSSLFGIAEPHGDRTRNQQIMPVESVEDEEYLATRQIALFAGMHETEQGSKYTRYQKLVNLADSLRSTFASLACFVKCRFFFMLNRR